MKQLKLVLVLAMCFAVMSFGKSVKINMAIDAEGMQQAADMQMEQEQAPVEKKQVKKHHEENSAKTLTAAMGEDGIELSDGRTIPVTYGKAMFPYPQIEVVEPAGAKVTIYYDQSSEFNGEIPFIWKDAGIDEYVKMVVNEGDVTWSIKFQAKKGKEITIGTKGAEPREKHGHHDEGSVRSRHFSVETRTPRAGEAFVIKFFDFPAKGMDWMNIVPAGAPENEWGQWTYTNGSQGEYTVPTLTPGKYEIRAYYDYPNGGYTVRDRLKITVR